MRRTSTTGNNHSSCRFARCWSSSVDRDFISKVKQDVEYYVNKSTSINRVLLFPPLPSHYRFLIHKVIEECDPNVNLHTLSVGENDQRRTLVYFGHGVKVKDSRSTMPNGNDASRNGTFLVRTVQSKHNMITDEISPSSMREPGERRRRPDMQLYVPKARRLSDVKDKAKDVGKNALLSSSEPRKVLSSMQHKQIEESTSNSHRGVKGENGPGRKVQQKEKRFSKLPAQSQPTNGYLKTNPVNTPVPSSDRSNALVETKTATMNESNRITFQRSPSGIDCSNELPNIDICANRQKKAERVSKNNQASPSFQVAKPRKRNTKPACDSTIVPNCVKPGISNTAVKEASPEQRGELCDPAANALSNSSPLKKLEEARESRSSQKALRQLSVERLNARAQKPCEFVGKADVGNAVHKDDICLKENDGNRSEQTEKDFPIDKEEIATNDVPDSSRSNPDTASSNAKADLLPAISYKTNITENKDDIDGNQLKSKTLTEPCEILTGDCIHKSGSCENQLSDSKDEPPVEFVCKTDNLDHATSKNELVPEVEAVCKIDNPNDATCKNEIIPEELDADEAKQPNIVTFLHASNKVKIVKESNVIESFSDRNKPEIALTNSRDKVTPVSEAKTIVPVVECLEDMKANVACSSCDDDEDSWDAIYDDSGECLDQAIVAQLTSAVGDVSIEVPQIDYLSFQAKEPQISDKEFGHVLEIYNFPKEFKTEDVRSAFSNFNDEGFDIKWVNDTRALAVFSSCMAAEHALTMLHPIVSARPLSQGSREAKLKVRHCAEFCQVYKKRPETSVRSARRMMGLALGVHLPVSKEKLDMEKKQLIEAKERKRLAIKQRKDAWEGNVGNAD